MMECWSCKKILTLQQRLEADGMCPHCDAEIELESDASASQPYTEPDYYVVVTTANVWQTFCKTRAEADSIVSKPFHKGYYILEVYARPAAAPQLRGSR
ncbi:hypothetical protein EXT62_10195 [Pectobacterium carotovorum subsp. carotovorum]|nr:hypothetical protein [Pectobacterium carotovorum]MCL6397255.1 hypothetical protein [Pectobacterium carotovorum subsp. carotovorum]